MRSLIYAVAVVLASGLAYYVATPQKPGANGNTTPEAVAVNRQVMDQAGALTLQVDDMHCPFACYPSVKETLEKQQHVTKVELVPQKDKDAIDTPQVVIAYQPGFDLTAALGALDKKGFQKHSIVQ